METTPQKTSPQDGKPNLFVLQSGLITSALALAGVWWVNHHSEENIMGWYANYVIPMGAMIVGFVAGSGYALASWFTGARINRKLLMVVLLLQTICYVGAEYVEYRDVRNQWEKNGLVLKETNELPTFFQYYDLKAKSFTWKPEHSDQPDSEPIGTLGGYFFLLLGAVGFIGAGAIAPAILMAVPYCQTCQRYMKTRQVGLLPASVMPKKIPAMEVIAKAAYEKEQQDAAANANESVKRLCEFATAGDFESFRKEFAAAPPAKVINKLPVRAAVSLIWCKTCNTGHIIPSVMKGHGKQIQTTKLSRTDVSADFVRGLLNKNPS